MSLGSIFVTKRVSAVAIDESLNPFPHPNSPAWSLVIKIESDYNLRSLLRSTAAPIEFIAYVVKETSIVALVAEELEEAEFYRPQS